MDPRQKNSMFGGPEKRPCLVSSRKRKTASITGVNREKVADEVGEGGFCGQCKDLGFYTDEAGVIGGPWEEEWHDQNKVLKGSL